MDDGACRILEVSVLLGSCLVGWDVLTRLELNGDGLIGAFHQKPTMPVSQALSIAAFKLFVQHAPEASKREGCLT